ncbi:MAG: prepilin-type N-terminal cleavage/methylation domain-containing protein, partial [Planctomycetota bacterium]
MIALPEYPAPNPKFPPRGLENRCFGFRPAFTLIELMVVI